MVLFLLKSVRHGVVFQGESSTQLELNSRWDISPAGSPQHD